MSLSSNDGFLTQLVGRGCRLELWTEWSPSGRYWVVKEENAAGEAWYRIMAPGWFGARYFKAWHSSEYGWTRFIPTFETAEAAEAWLDGERAHWELREKRSKVSATPVREIQPTPQTPIRRRAALTAEPAELVAWGIVDSWHDTGIFAVYLDEKSAKEQANIAAQDGPCHVVKLVPAEGE